MEQTKIVMYPNVARKLLKLGYRVVDIKAKKEDARSTLFVFAVEGNFKKDFDRLMAEFEALLKEKEVEKA